MRALCPYLSIFFLCIACLSKAQEFTVSENQESISWRAGVSGFIRMPAGDFMALTYDGKWSGPASAFTRYVSGPFSIRKWGPDLKETETASFDVKDMEKAGLPKIVNLGGKLFVFYATKASTGIKDNLDIHLNEVDPVSLKFLSETTVATIVSDGKFDLNYAISPHRQYLLLMLNNKKRKTEADQLITIDNNGKQTRTSKYEFEEPVSLNGFLVNDSGSVYVAFQDKTDDETENLHVDLYEGPTKARAVKRIIDLGGNIAFKSDLYTNRETGKTYIMGTTEHKRYGNLSGSFIGEVSAKQSKIKAVVSEFDEALLAKIDKDGFAKANGKDPGLEKSFFPISFLTRSDGSMDMVLEYTANSDGEKASFFFTGTLLDLHYKDDKLTITRIPKAQRQASTNFQLSTYVFTYNDKLVMLYNEKQANLGKALQEQVGTTGLPGRAILTAVIISSDNKAERKGIWDSPDSKGLEPMSFVMLENNRILLPQSRATLTNFKYQVSMLNVR